MRRNPLQSFFRIGVHVGRDVAGKFAEAGYRSAEGLVYAEEELRNGTLSAALFEREVHLARFITHQYADERKREEDENNAHDDGKQRGDARPPAEKLGYPPIESLQHDRKHRGKRERLKEGREYEGGQYNRRRKHYHQKVGPEPLGLHHR